MGLLETVRPVTKHVLITISGEHRIDGQAKEPVTTKTKGEYYFRNGRHFVRFTQSPAAESGADPVKNLFKFTPDCLEVIKSGGIESRMIFEKDRMNVVQYRTPSGILEMGMKATEIRLTEEPARIEICVDYELHAGGSKIQDSRVTIGVIPFPYF